MNLRLFLGSLLLTACAGTSSHAPPQDPDQRITIMIQPLGEPDPASVDSLANALRSGHKAAVRLAPARELPEKAFTNLRTPRYRADTLIAWLKEIKPDSIDLILGLTNADISITKYDADGSIKDPGWKYADFGIFGLGYLGGPSCVVSTFRYAGKPRFYERLWKIAVHEIGHTRSLPHCADPTCVMRDAVESMSTIDAADRHFCAQCEKRLSSRYIVAP